MNYRKIVLKQNVENKGILDRILALRNINTDEEKEKFLNPSFSEFISPFAFCDMKKVLDRIFCAIKKNEKILIWGDFDCDGVTSTSILYKALEYLKANVIQFIPDRLTQGHGIDSKQLIKLISKERVKLIITVDCGISNVKEVALAKGLGVDTIITDHHTTDTELPLAFAIINPQVSNALSPSLNIEDINSLTYNSGSIIAYKLAMALLEKNDNIKLKEELLLIAACGAIADVVPLIGENRSIVAMGLKILNEKKINSNKGIYKLLSQNVQNRDICATDIGFILAPRINAVGRLANASLSFEFLTTQSEAKLNIIIEKLNNYNTIRQAQCLETYEEIKKYLDFNKQEKNNPAIILMNKEWHIGIIGIVAARIVEEFQKPCFLITIDEQNHARCSIRSNETINVYQVLKENQNLFLGFGGHKLAGGCSFDLNEIKFEDVKNSLLKTIKETSDNLLNSNVLYADLKLEADDIDCDLIETINKLEPFGQNNEMPVCAMFGAILKEAKPIGKELNHLRLVFSKNDKIFNCVKWQESEIKIPINSSCDIAFSPRLNEFNNIKSVSLEIIDVYSEAYQEADKNTNKIKIFNHRQKTGILDKISKYLSNEVLDIGVWAKTKNTKDKIGKYDNITKRIINNNTVFKEIMFFDYPVSKEDFLEILDVIQPEKIHFMNCCFDENIENYVKQLSGMVKYSFNKLDGNLDLIRISQALGMNINFVQICLEIMEEINSIEILDVDKIKYNCAFNYEDFKNSSLFEQLKQEFNSVIEFKKYFLNCDIREIENILALR